MFSLMPRRKSMMTTPRLEAPFGWLPEEFEHMFNRLFTRWPMEETAEWPYGWGMTTEEKEKEVIMRFELPGFEPPELKVEVAGGVLTVEAEHKVPEAKEKEEKKPERVHTHVKRVLTLPPEVEPEKVMAVYRNGVLEVSFARKAEMTPHRIEVKT
jgi:HSP20 family protein